MEGYTSYIDGCVEGFEATAVQNFGENTITEFSANASVTVYGSLDEGDVMSRVNAVLAKHANNYGSEILALIQRIEGDVISDLEALKIEMDIEEIDVEFG